MVELLEVTIWDSDDFTNDKCLGVAEIDIAEDVAKAPGGRIYKTWYLQVQNSSAACLHACKRSSDGTWHFHSQIWPMCFPPDGCAHTMDWI